MPTVERYPNVGQVRHQPAPPTYLSTNPALAAAASRRGAQLGGLFNTIGKELERIQAQQDEEAALSATTQLENLHRELLFNPQTGAMTMQGANAVGLSKRVMGQLDDAYKKTLSGLGNNRQRKAVRAAYLQMRGATEQRLMVWEGEQSKVAMVGALEARANSAISDAATNPLDPENMADAMTRGLDAVSKASTIAGDAPDKREERLDAFRSTFHTQVIQRMVDLKPAWAAAYYRENRTEIDGTKHAAIEKLLEEGGMAQRSQEATDALIAKHGAGSAALRAARAQYDGKLRDEVVRRIKARYNESRTMAENGRSDQLRAARQWLVDNPDKTPDDMPPSMRGKLIADGHWAHVQTVHRDMHTKTVDLDRLRRLEQLRVTDPVAYMNEDIAPEIGRLGSRGLQMLEEQKQWRLAGGPPMPDRMELAETNDWLTQNKDILVAHNIDPNPKPGDKTAAEKLAKVNDYMLDILNKHRRANRGQEMPEDMKREALRRALLTVYPAETRGISGFGISIGTGATPLYSVPVDERSNYRTVRELSDIPQTDVERIGAYVDRDNKFRQAQGLPMVDRVSRIKAIYSNEQLGVTSRVR